MKNIIRPLAGIVAFAILCLLEGCSPTPIFFDVSNLSVMEKLPSVASSTKTGDFFVAFLMEYSDASGTHMELRVRRFDSSGNAIPGFLYPLGSGSHKALGRPAIAYNSSLDQFFVAVPERVTQGGQTWDRVIGRHLDGTGKSLPGPDFLFDSKSNTFYDGPSSATDGHNSLHVVANTLLKEFLVTVQLTVGGNNGVWAQTVKGYLGPYGNAVELANTGINGFYSHAVAYAPVAGTTPAGGRYIFTISGTPMMLDAQLKPILVTAQDKNNPNLPTSSCIFLNLGYPEGKSDQFDIAYGEVQKKKRFLMVYSDGDNLPPGNTSSTVKWTGVWATYIDPERLFYTDFAPGPRHNTPFPVSYIWEHMSGERLHNPQVVYSESAKAFYVVWREVPTNNSNNPDTLSHIRGVCVDYFVDDGSYGTSTVPNPNTNRVLSWTTAGGLQPYPNITYSLEDPDYPDAAALPAKGLTVVWQQNGPVKTTDRDVYGRMTAFP